MSEVNLSREALGITRKTYKKSYKKTTTGCSDCKARRIKCDEGRPVCMNCKKRFPNVTSCVYDNSRSAKRAPSNGSTRLSNSSSSPDVQLHRTVSCKPYATSDTEHLLELRLLWHYTQVTHGNQSLKAMLPLLSSPLSEIIIPQVAFSCPSVLHALLGLSAIHLLAISPNDRDLNRVSASYLDQALLEHQEGIENLDDQNAKSLLVSAVLIVHQTWLTTNLTDSRDGFLANMHTYHMCKGMMALLKRADPLDTYISALQDHDKFQMDNTSNINFMKSATKDMARLSIDFPTSDAPSENTPVYQEVADEIIEISYLIANATIGSRLIEHRLVSLLHRVSPKFANLLESNDPMALVLMARAIALLCLVEESGAWWVHGAGACKVPVRAIWHIHGLLMPQWLWAMEWPLKLVTKEIRLDVEFSPRVRFSGDGGSE